MSMIQNNIRIQTQNAARSLEHEGNSNRMSVDLIEKYAFALTVLACAVCTAGISIGAFVVVAAFALLVFKPEYLLGPLLFFSIFDNYMLLMQGSSISRFITLYCIAGAVLQILKQGTIKKQTFLFVVLIFLGVFLSFYGILDYTSIPISYILNLILAIAMVNTITSGDKVRIVRDIYRYCVLSAIYIYILFSINGFDSIVDGMRLSISEDVNTNELAMGLAIVMAVLASNLVVFGKHKLLNVLLMIATCVAIFFTGSRTGLISGVVATFFVYIVGTNEKGTRKKAILLSVVSVIALVWVYSYLQKSYPLLMERFTVESIEETGGTGRLDVWKAYLREFFPRYWLLGIGFDPSNLFYAMRLTNGVGHGAHNVVIEILSKTGMIGAVAYGTCFIQYFRAMFRTMHKNKYVLFSLAVVLSILINGIGENILTTRFLWFGIGLGYLLSAGNEKKQVYKGGDYGC